MWKYERGIKKQEGVGRRAIRLLTCLPFPTMEQPIGYIPSQRLAVLFFLNFGINMIYFIISLTNY